MRIIGGYHRGRKLNRPPETITRPTMDKVRESIFNMIIHGDWEDIGDPLNEGVILDAFGGSGALALEAISRGANKAYIFEKNNLPYQIIKENVASLKEQNKVTLMKANATIPPEVPEPITLVLLDPPFGKDLVSICIPILLAKGWISKQTLIVAEIESSESITIPEGFEILKERVYGTAKVFFIRYKG